MTGRRLYDHHCDATREYTAVRWEGQIQGWMAKAPLIAWPFLGQQEQRRWNNLARRITPALTPRRRVD